MGLVASGCAVPAVAVWDRWPMSPSADRSSDRTRWWETRSGSLGILAATLVLVALSAVVLAGRVTGALSDVGRDADGSDPWTDPIGMEPVARGYLVAHLPNCAAAPITRITIWDQDSKPIWDVTGPPTALPAFIVGVVPRGFKELTPYDKPSRSTLVRLLVDRRLLGVAGVRYRAQDLRAGKVTTYYEGAYHTFSRAGFQAADVCKRGSDSSNVLPNGQRQTTTTN